MWLRHESFGDVLLITGTRLTQQFERSETFKRYGVTSLRQLHPRCAHLPDDSDAYWRCYIRHQTFHQYHPTGTCKMGGAHDETAVVDPQLR